MDGKERFHQRIIHLKSLKDGWYEGTEGVALDQDGLDWLEKLLENFLEPAIFPMLDGRINMEWYCYEDHFMNMEMDIVDKKGVLYANGIETLLGYNDSSRDASIQILKKAIDDFYKENLP